LALIVETGLVNIPLVGFDSLDFTSFRTIA
jgi:hypothetical protein